MTAVMRKELSSYFHSPVGYIFLAAYYALAGFYVRLGALYQYTSDLTQTFSSLFSITLFLVPILTMRLMSEELRHKTDQALLTAPLSLTRLVLGKFLAAVIVYAMGLSVTIVYGLVFMLYSSPDWTILLGNYLALLLMGMALIAIGLFISSLTESQVIAAIGGFSISLLLLLIDAMRSISQNQLLNAIIAAVSFYDRYSVFTVGIFDFASIFFFLSVCAIFLFLTVRVFDKRRWG